MAASENENTPQQQIQAGETFGTFDSQEVVKPGTSGSLTENNVDLRQQNVVGSTATPVPQSTLQDDPTQSNQLDNQVLEGNKLAADLDAAAEVARHRKHKGDEAIAQNIAVELFEIREANDYVAQQVMSASVEDKKLDLSDFTFAPAPLPQAASDSADEQQLLIKPPIPKPLTFDDEELTTESSKSMKEAGLDISDVVSIKFDQKNINKYENGTVADQNRAPKPSMAEKSLRSETGFTATVKNLNLEPFFRYGDDSSLLVKNALNTNAKGAFSFDVQPVKEGQGYNVNVLRNGVDIATLTMAQTQTATSAIPHVNIALKMNPAESSAKGSLVGNASKLWGAVSSLRGGIPGPTHEATAQSAPTPAAAASRMSVSPSPGHR